MRYQELLELFDQKAEYSWLNSGMRSVATFTVDDVVYRVSFISRYDPSANEEVEIFFKGDDKTSITNTGNAFTVFATVIDIILQYVRKHNSPTFYFSSENEPSRLKLYDRLVNNLKSNLPYSLQKYQEHGEQVYRFTKE